MDLTPKQFEQLLCEFCAQDLPVDFTVEHDIKDIGSESGNKRQIDTKIKGRVGISNLLICGEAKYWDEPVGSETIDSLVGKYMTGEIRANKVIVFSNRGYTAPAVTRAKLLGIELLEPKEVGVPIKQIPYIVGICYLGQMIIRASHLSPQQNLMAINPDDYIILKGDERISFHQNVFRIVTSILRQLGPKGIDMDLSKLNIKDSNVLYELKQKEGYRYNANFEIEISLKWDFFFEYLSAGVLHHLNSEEIKFVNLQGHPGEVLSKVLLSPTKGNYEDRVECIEQVVNKNIGHTFMLCMPDPDRQKTHPQEPIFSFI